MTQSMAFFTFADGFTTAAGLAGEQPKPPIAHVRIAREPLNRIAARVHCFVSCATCLTSICEIGCAHSHAKSQPNLSNDLDYECLLRVNSDQLPIH